jgi:putative sigma-54 modulation protein
MDSRRQPLPAWIPRPLKRASGTGRQDSITAHVRVIGATLAAQQETYIREKLGLKLGRYAAAIERISVRVTDVNGPRGGIDQRCRIKVVLSALPSVVVERRHAELQAAIDMGLRAVSEAVRRIVGRRRMKPHRRTAGRPPVAAA